SSMRALGAPLPSFQLPDVRSGQVVSESDLAGPCCVVAFICNHCPFVKTIKPQLAEFGLHCERLGVPMVAISSNDAISHPSDGPTPMAEDAARFGYSFPYLYDESQRVARAFDATCTPDFFVFDRDSSLAYRGQFDGSRPSNDVPVTGK